MESNECKLQAANDEVIVGPVWLSKGERFRPTGAYIYLELRCKELYLQLKKLKIHYKETMIAIKAREKRTMNEYDSNETTDDAQIPSTESTDKEERKILDTSSIQDKSLLSMSAKELKETKQVKGSIE